MVFAIAQPNVSHILVLDDNSFTVLPFSPYFSLGKPGSPAVTRRAETKASETETVNVL